MKQILSLAVAASIIISPVASAAVSDEDFAALREQLAAVSARLDQLEAENAELKRLLADAELDKAILKEALKGKY